MTWINTLADTTARVSFPTPAAELSVTAILTVVSILVSLVTTTVFVGRKVGSFESNLTGLRSDLSEHLTRMASGLGEVSQQVRTAQNEVLKLGVALFGVDGSNGLRSEIRRLIHDVTVMDARLTKDLHTLDAHVQSLRQRVTMLERDSADRSD